MKKEKSKILKLKKKYNRTLWLEKNLFKIIAITIFPSVAAMCLAAILQILPLLIVGISFFIVLFGVISCGVVIHNLIFNKRAKIDDEIEKLISSDEQEKQILKEYNSIEELKNETKVQIKGAKALIREMINRKNQEAEEQNKLIKELTKKKQAEAEQEVIKELEQQESSKYKDFDIRDYRDDL